MSSEKSVEEGKWNVWNFFKIIIFTILKIWLGLLMVGPRQRVFVILRSLTGRPRSFAKSLSLRLFMTFDTKVVKEAVDLFPVLNALVQRLQSGKPNQVPTKLIWCLKRCYFNQTLVGWILCLRSFTAWILHLRWANLHRMREDEFYKIQ